MTESPNIVREGIVVKKKGYHPFIDVDLVDEEFLSYMSEICVYYGLNVNRPPMFSSKDNNDGSLDKYNKYRILSKQAAKHVTELYFKGHKTVFDLFHHYYSLFGAIQKGSLEKIASITEEIAKKATLQGFFLHHIFQRYVTDANFDFGEWTEHTKKQILKNTDLYRIAQFLIYSESDFFYDNNYFYQECKKRTKNLSKSDKVKTYSSEINGGLYGEVLVPKTSEYLRIRKEVNCSSKKYLPEILFPELFDSSLAIKVFEENPVERLNILHTHPNKFFVENKLEKISKEIIGKYPKLKNDKNAIDILIKDGNYSFNIQTKMLE